MYFIEHPIPYARILAIVGLYVACDTYFMDTFALFESKSLWVHSFFHSFLFWELDMRTFLLYYKLT